MSEFIFKLPDLGEGTVEAEIIEWHVKPGDTVREGDVIVDVMTDKANIEVPAPTDGTVLRITGEPGDLVAVGAELIAFGSNPGSTAASVDAVASDATQPVPALSSAVATAADPAPRGPRPPAATTDSTEAPKSIPGEAGNRNTGKVLASPALRRRAAEMGVDLSTVVGSGPKGRILRRDLAGYPSPNEPERAAAAAAQRIAARSPAVEEIKVIGVRRVIAERMQRAMREIPHFAYIEEVDITHLEQLRRDLNQRNDRQLTYLPFIAMALMRSLLKFPQCNQRFDAERGVLQRHSAVHLGIATQTSDGLKVPVVHDAQALGLWALGSAIQRVTAAAREGSATPQQLSGSTITLTSLGKLGGIASTPVINAPEMGIIGVNKAALRPMIVEGHITPRLMMNLSSSFDHRFIDGFDAASMIQELKAHLEQPALMFASPGPG